MPCHPILTRYLLAHLREFGTGPDGRLFRGERGGDLSESVYSRVWAQARALALPPALARTPIARRAYDLRHACLSSWLNGGVEQTQVAQWAGNSVKVLMETYAKCIHGHDQINRKRMDAAFKDASTGERTGRQSPEEEAAENLARALAAYDAKRALATILEATRQLVPETGITETSLPDDVRAALSRARDVMGDA